MRVNHYILPEKISKGQTAGKRLAALNWPRNLHQKLIDKRYNVTFRAVSPTPDTKLTRDANIAIPLLNPKELKEERARFLKMTGWLLGIMKGRLNLEKKLALLMRLDATNERERKKQIAALRKQAEAYVKGAENLMKECKAANSKCGSVKLMKWVGNKAAYRLFSKQAGELEKKLADADVKFDKAIDRLIKGIREFRSAEDGLNKELADSMALIKGVAGVMP